MNYLQKHPIHIRKKIALAITMTVGFILIILLVIVYISPKKAPKDNGSGSKIKDFYYSISGKEIKGINTQINEIE